MRYQDLRGIAGTLKMAVLEIPWLLSIWNKLLIQAYILSIDLNYNITSINYYLHKWNFKKKEGLFDIITVFVDNICMIFSGNINSINKFFNMKNRYVGMELNYSRYRIRRDIQQKMLL